MIEEEENKLGGGGKGRCQRSAKMKEIVPKRQRDGKDVSRSQTLPRTVHFPPSKGEEVGGDRVLGWPRQDLGGALQGSPPGPTACPLSSPFPSG